jgi:hypothetical protein
MTSEIVCARCNFMLGEKGQLSLPERGQCPRCGSSARRVVITAEPAEIEHIIATAPPGQVHATARSDVIRVRADLPRATAVGEHRSDESTLDKQSATHAHTAGEPTLEEIAAVVTVAEEVKEVAWIEPTDKNGSYTCTARDSSGKILAIAESRDWQEGLLAVAEELGPEAPGG